MKLDLLKLEISEKDYQEIERLLLISEHNPPELEDVWRIMDVVWDELDCDSNKINLPEITEFYKHPVWLLNGLFIESHKLSIQHRSAIADWISGNTAIISILDYGGGFGTLTRFISEKNKNLHIDIYEPFPHQYALRQIEAYPNINFVSSIKNQYDCLVSTDVLEHVPDPLKLLSEMIESVKPNGYLIIGNCFYPVIKCHLPRTFHLRYSFNYFTNLMGLEIIESCEGSHALVYQKLEDKTLDWFMIRLTELLSKLLFPILQNPFFLQIARFFKKTIDKALSPRKA
ncbi:bifunctional 2-polyprenyl-6-hydroxyphenol methylase/3-demethylubiquinol 3-O-methyltransferase UbiG [Trichocoleus sp. FACHB-262]|uniref:class I SAM-dependent methyltransferase n=1 Tax=Trichocoleus sp. FACHB-262 TaxID=2692869 RepID=UPI001684BFAB|nr:methyltransferase domain-containing protein [Trichocoleus sp. FACHB-262]MBD2124681.1 methyltransferase domain-containing protein [Trichocoleus sp. FACHB-262]